LIQKGSERQIQAVHKYRQQSLTAPEVENIAMASPVSTPNYQDSVWLVNPSQIDSIDAIK
jgi:hypothetical protein